MPKLSICFIASSCSRAERLADLAPAMGEEAQRPRRGDAGILLPQRAGRGIARVGEDLAARRFLPLVQGGEVGLRHIDLAAHFEDVGRAGDALRNIARSSATLAVTSSPTVPSPRVAASTSSPFS